MGLFDQNQYNCREIGDPEHERIKILIREDIGLHIMKKSNKLIGAKSFGLLIGNKYEDGNRIVVYIDHIVPVGKLENIKDSTTFTDKKWIALRKTALKNKRGKEIVGWYGVRIGLGAMLTQEDQWLHQNFFHQPWQIAYLLDGENSFGNLYYWYQKDLRRSDGYYLLVDDTNEKKNNKAGFTKLFLQSSIAIFGIMLLFTLYTQYIHPHILSSGNKDKGLQVSDLYKEEEANKQLTDQQIEELKDTIYYLESKLKSKEDEIETLKESAEQAQDSELSRNRDVHIIQKGETLATISEKYYGDPSYNIALAKVNRISNYNSIYAGYYLIIPSKDEIEQWK